MVDVPWAKAERIAVAGLMLAASIPEDDNGWGNLSRAQREEITEAASAVFLAAASPQAEEDE